MQKRVALKDIANRVGVSIALVSYVMNNQEKEKRVGAEVVKKIREAAAELNYQPNQIARSLRMKTTKTIGLIVADISNPFFGQLARIIENEANKMGYTVIFGSSDEDEKKSEILINTLMNRQVDGFIIVPTERSNDQILGLIRKKFPVVLLDRYFPEINASHVVLNNYQATYEAATYLIEKGYKNISMVAHKSNLIHMKERIRGYMEAMENHHLAAHRHLFEIRYDHYDEEIVCVFGSDENERKNSDALLFATNTLSIYGLHCIRKNCRKIPEDYAFIGFDGGDAFDLFSPPLNFVQQPLEEMGKESCRLLRDLMNGSKKITQMMLNPSLVIRDNKGC